MALVSLDGKTISVKANAFNCSYISTDEIMYTDDAWLFSALAIKFEIDGLTGIIERDCSGGNYKKHIHLSKGNKSFSQNEDGSPHDGSTGTPSNKIKKKLKESYGWDWDEKEENWINKININCKSITDTDVYTIAYPNGRIVTLTVNTSHDSINPITKELLREYYTGETSVSIDIYEYFPVYFPIIDTMPIPSPGTMPVGVPLPI